MEKVKAIIKLDGLEKGNSMAINDFDIETEFYGDQGGTIDSFSSSPSDFDIEQEFYGDQGGTLDKPLGDDTELKTEMGRNEKMALLKGGLTGAAGIAESLLTIGTGKRNREAQAEIDALYDAQEDLNRIERKRQEAETEKLQRRQDQLNKMQRSYIQRGRDFQDRFLEELEKQDRSIQASDRIKSRANSADQIREYRLMRGK